MIADISSFNVADSVKVNRLCSLPMKADEKKIITISRYSGSFQRNSDVLSLNTDV